VNRDELKEEILESKTYRKFKKVVSAIRDQFDPGKIDAEIKSLHSGRLTRSMGSATKINPKQMIDAVIREVANRSRLVEIRVNLVEQKVNLEKAIKAIRNYFLSEFQVPGLKYKTDRVAYFSRFYREAQFLLDEIDRLIDSCDHFVKDIDQTGFGTRLIKECLDMIYVKERSI
jgi:hypothetical protein